MPRRRDDRSEWGFGEGFASFIPAHAGSTSGLLARIGLKRHPVWDVAFAGLVGGR